MLSLILQFNPGIDVCVDLLYSSNTFYSNMFVC